MTLYILFKTKGTIRNIMELLFFGLTFFSLKLITKDDINQTQRISLSYSAILKRNAVKTHTHKHIHPSTRLEIISLIHLVFY